MPFVRLFVVGVATQNVGRCPWRVLLVDDHEDTIEGYAAYLHLAGAHVYTARDGREAIVKARQLQPDVIVMDLNMPVVDGWRAVRWLKRKRRTRSIPVIALSAQIMDVRDESRASAAGFDAVCGKPCLPSDLITLIQRVLRGRQEQRQPSCETAMRAHGRFVVEAAPADSPSPD